MSVSQANGKYITKPQSLRDTGVVFANVEHRVKVDMVVVFNWSWVGIAFWSKSLLVVDKTQTSYLKRLKKPTEHYLFLTNNVLMQILDTFY